MYMHGIIIAVVAIIIISNFAFLVLQHNQETMKIYCIYALCTCSI